jgi:putative ATP-dependent endonuclease of OLD family
MTLVHKGKVFPLRPEETKLAPADYEYLHRFLDATKSNLFFARGVAIVEGPAEALLLPAIAEVAGLSFSKYGVSVVNVGNVGLYHYARIFQRSATGESIPIPVACITDRDIVPDSATYVIPSRKRRRFEKDYPPGEAAAAVKRKVVRVEATDDPEVRVFVSNYWTLEYDLAAAGLAEVMFLAIELAKMEKSKGERLTDVDEAKALQGAKAAWPTVRAAYTTKESLAIAVYQPLYEEDASKAVAAQYAAKLLYSKVFGSGQTLLDALPPYLKAALRHLTATSDSAPAAEAKATSDPELAGAMATP